MITTIAGSTRHTSVFDAIRHRLETLDAKKTLVLSFFPFTGLCPATVFNASHPLFYKTVANVLKDGAGYDSIVFLDIQWLEPLYINKVMTSSMLPCAIIVAVDPALPSYPKLEPLFKTAPRKITVFTDSPETPYDAAVKNIYDAITDRDDLSPGTIDYVHFTTNLSKRDHLLSIYATPRYAQQAVISKYMSRAASQDTSLYVLCPSNLAKKSKVWRYSKASKSKTSFKVANASSAAIELWQSVKNGDITEHKHNFVICYKGSELVCTTHKYKNQGIAMGDKVKVVEVHDNALHSVMSRQHLRIVCTQMPLTVDIIKPDHTRLTLQMHQTHIGFVSAYNITARTWLPQFKYDRIYACLESQKNSADVLDREKWLRKAYSILIRSSAPATSQWDMTPDD